MKTDRTIPEPGQGGLEQRLDDLAARCRRLQTAVCALAVVVAVLVSGGADALQRFKSIETEELVLRDAEGKKRGWFGVGKDGNARLSVFDKQEKELVMLGVAPDGGTLLFLTGPPGERAVTVGVDAEGLPLIELTGDEKAGASLRYHPRFESGLFLRDSKGRDRLAASLTPSGNPQFHFSDTADKMRVGLGAAPDDSYSLTFLDADGNQRLSLGLTPDRSAHVDLMERFHKARIGLTATEDGTCDLSVQDHAGHPRAGMGVGAEGSVSALQLRDSAGENGIALKVHANGHVHQHLESQANGGVISLGIDRDGTAGLTVFEHKTRARIGIATTPGLQAVFYANDKDGKHRAVLGVTSDDREELQLLGRDEETFARSRPVSLPRRSPAGTGRPAR
jgi:hypothetical protein